MFKFSNKIKLSTANFTIGSKVPINFGNTKTLLNKLFNNTSSLYLSKRHETTGRCTFRPNYHLIPGEHKSYRIYDYSSEKYKLITNFLNKTKITKKIANDDVHAFDDVFYFIHNMVNCKVNITSGSYDDYKIKNSDRLNAVAVSGEMKDIEYFEKYLEENFPLHIEPKPIPVKHKILNWSSWDHRYIKSDDQDYYDGKISNGLEDYKNMIRHDTQGMKTKTELAYKLGATSGRNYLLYGPPGTGKSTFIREFVAETKDLLYITKMKPLQNNLSEILSPPKIKNYQGLYVVLLEDFDRYIKSYDKDYTSEILNALDGVVDNSHIIRFFSANDIKKIQSNTALMSRFSRILYFNNPTENAIITHINNLFPQTPDVNKIFVEKIVHSKFNNELSYRNINNFLSRYYVYDNVVEMALLDMDKWFEEMKLTLNF